MTTISMQKHSGQVIKKPLISEKAVSATEKNQYVFVVAMDATKQSIMKAVEAIYKVKPVKVNIVRGLQKKVIVRGRRGQKAAVKKAYVFLKKGDKIEIA